MTGTASALRWRATVNDGAVDISIPRMEGRHEFLQETCQLVGFCAVAEASEVLFLAVADFVDKLRWSGDRPARWD